MIPFAGAAEILHCLVRVGLCLCATTTCWGVGSAWGDGLLVPGWGWGCGCFIAGAEQKVESGGGDGTVRFVKQPPGQEARKNTWL